MKKLVAHFTDGYIKVIECSTFSISDGVVRLINNGITTDIISLNNLLNIEVEDDGRF